jgi:hypothetical protein
MMRIVLPFAGQLKNLLELLTYKSLPFRQEEQKINAEEAEVGGGAGGAGAA